MFVLKIFIQKGIFIGETMHELPIGIFPFHYIFLEVVILLIVQVLHSYEYEDGEEDLFFLDK